MRISRVCLGWIMAAAIPTLAAAQATAPATAPTAPQKPSEAEDKDRTVAGGGISVPGWTGKVDAKGAAAGVTVKDSKSEQQGDAVHLTVGPATTYWNPAKMEQREGRVDRVGAGGARARSSSTSGSCC